MDGRKRAAPGRESLPAQLPPIRRPAGHEVVLDPDPVEDPGDHEAHRVGDGRGTVVEAGV